MKAHCYYHDQLVAKKIDFIKPDGSLNYPCLGSFSKNCGIFADLLPLNFSKTFFEKGEKNVINHLTIIAIIRSTKMSSMPSSNSPVDFLTVIIGDSGSIELIIGKISTPTQDFTVR